MTPPATSPRLILASQSPRRRRMLEDAGIPFELAPAIDDGGLLPGDASAGHWVAALAFLKAWSVARDLDHNDSVVIVGADTVCASDDGLLGKPADADEAREMINSFVNTSHAVLTGVAIVSPGGRRELIVDRAHVTWGDVPQDEIERYIDSGQWQGKAGGYNLTERTEAGWSIAVTGDPTTVMGLPMLLLPARLAAWNEENQPGGAPTPSGSAA